MNKEIAAKAKYLKAENKKWPGWMTRVPEIQWPQYRSAKGERVVMVFRSSQFLVQVYDEAGGTRISVCRTRLNVRGDFDDGITWIELQSIKSQCGFGAMRFVEIYPADDDVVNVANMRHLWLLPASTVLGWKKGN